VIDDNLVHTILNESVRVSVVETAKDRTVQHNPLTIDISALLEKNKLEAWHQIEGDYHNTSAPEVEISISVAEPILTPEEADASSVLSLRVFSAHSLPEKWSIKDLNVFGYGLQLHGLPNENGLTEELALTNGLLFQPAPQDPNTSQSSTELTEQEAKWKTIEDTKARITWNITRKKFLAKSAIEKWKNALAAGNTNISFEVSNVLPILR
jgi:hypothetical protein